MKNLKKISNAGVVIMLVCLLSITVSCRKSDIIGLRGNGEIVTETIELSSINGVELSISGDVIITQGDVQEITIEAQQNIIDNIETKVVGGVWEIEFDRRVSHHDGITIYITTPSLEKIDISGSGNITCSSFTTENFDIDISGSGSVIASVNASNLDARISGSGDLSISGLVNYQDLHISGSGRYNAYSCESNKCDISISGSGNCNVFVNDLLNVKISGSGDVNYKGYPSINTSISGSGKLNCRN